MIRHIEWIKKYSLGIDIIDNQHRQFLELMDQAYESFYKNRDKDQLAVLLGNLKDYTELHFGTEEKYFELFNYEYKDEHVRFHAQLKDMLKKLMLDFDAKGSDAIPSIIDFLEDWLVAHLSIEDKKYVKCFKEHGL